MGYKQHQLGVFKQLYLRKISYRKNTTGGRVNLNCQDIFIAKECFWEEFLLFSLLLPRLDSDGDGLKICNSLSFHLPALSALPLFGKVSIGMSVVIADHRLGNFCLPGVKS